MSSFSDPSAVATLLTVGTPYAFFLPWPGAARFTCIAGLVDRPLCLALLTSWCTGDWALALPLGIIFELLWLDTLELGGVVPPYGGLSFLLAFPLCRHFGLTQAGAALLPLFLSMLAAYAATWLELAAAGGRRTSLPRLLNPGARVAAAYPLPGLFWGPPCAAPSGNGAFTPCGSVRST